MHVDFFYCPYCLLEKSIDFFNYVIFYFIIISPKYILGRCSPRVGVNNNTFGLNLKLRVYLRLRHLTFKIVRLKL